MKRLVISRKGFDSSFGPLPSPIFPDGSLVSMPIPDAESPIRYGDIAIPGHRSSLGVVIDQLSGGRFRSESRAHLDPDLCAAAMPRPKSWRPAFGQQGAPQTHLRERGVGIGDMFLFFGWFREVERIAGRLRYSLSGRDMHVLFGWLHVADIIAVTPGDGPAWALMHPHLHGARAANNTLYCAAPNDTGAGSAGMFEKLHASLILTDLTQTKRSIWRLSREFSPGCMSFHDDATRWETTSDHVRLRTVGRGQEFVIDVERHPAIADWARTIIAENSSTSS